MNEALKTVEEKLRHAFCDADQGHVFNFWDDLSDSGKKSLLDQLNSIDLALLKDLIDEHIPGAKAEGPPKIAPAPVIRMPENPEETSRHLEAIKRGEAFLKLGKSAVLLVAGGQGSRLGFDGPKGLYPIGPVSKKCLFQIHAEKVLALSRRYGVRIPLLVMTSQSNHESTVEGFKNASFYGLSPDDVRFFSQGMLPAVDRSGRLILTDKGRLFKSPDGHGGSLRALATSGILKELDEKGIEQVFYFQVDNPLVKILDPAFIGHHLLAEAEMSLKFVRKRDAHEKVGVYAYLNDKPGIIEYSDVPEDLQVARNPDGSLMLDAGSIAIHLLSLEFIKSLVHGESLDLPFHRAVKAIRTIDDKGKSKIPEEPNGIKFEMFIFDAIPLAKTVVAMEIAREDEFSPVKNADGNDSPEVAKKDISAQFRRWLAGAGMKVEREDAPIEISPLFALDERELRDKLREGGWLACERLWIE